MKKTTLSSTSFFSALVAVSACTALSAVLAGNIAARVLLVQEVITPSESQSQPESSGPDEKWRQDLLRSLDDQLRNIKDLERNANQSKDTSLLSDIQNFRSSIDGHRSCVQNASTSDALQSCNEAMQSTWDASSKLWTKSDLVNRQRELKDMERQVKDAEREKIDVSKAKSVLEQYRTALTNVQNLLQSGAENRDVQDALQDAANPLQQEFYNIMNASRRQGDVARFRNEQLKNMERQIKDTERNKGDVTKLREILERVKAAVTAAEQLLLSGTADSRDLDDAFQVVYDTEREFGDLQNAVNRAGELRDREKDLKNMERELLQVEKKKGANAVALRQAFEEHKTQLAELKKLVESAADPQDINDAFQSFYDANAHQKFWDVMQQANRGKELQDREKDLKNMEKELLRTEKQKGANAGALRQAFEEYTVQLGALKKLIESAADPQDINDAFQALYDQEGPSQKFWNIKQGIDQGTELEQWTKKGGEVSNMEREIKRLAREKVDTSALQSLLDQMKAKIQAIQGMSPEDQRDAGEEVRDLQNEFWNVTNALNMKGELRQWTRKGGHLAKMEKIVKTLEKKGKDASAAASVVQDIRAAVATLEQSTDRDTLEEGRFTLDDLRRQFEDAIRPFLKKKAKGFPFPTHKQ